MSKIKNLLVSQPPPADYERSPYKALATKFGLKIVFRKLIKIEGLSAVDFRKQKVNILDYSAVILTSRNAVDYFFKLAEALKIEIPTTMKYFCSSETTAFYLQNYTQFRKRKIFYGKSNADLIALMGKHKDEKYLLPCSVESSNELASTLKSAKFNYTKAHFFRTIPEDVRSEIKIEDFDIIALFSPIGVKSIFENFPNFKQGDRIIATHGDTVKKAAKEAGLKVEIAAPNPKASTIPAAIENFLSTYYKNEDSQVDTAKEETAKLEPKKATKTKTKTSKDKDSEEPKRTTAKKSSSVKDASASASSSTSSPTASAATASVDSPKKRIATVKKGESYTICIGKKTLTLKNTVANHNAAVEYLKNKKKK